MKRKGVLRWFKYVRVCAAIFLTGYVIGRSCIIVTEAIVENVDWSFSPAPAKPSSRGGLGSVLNIEQAQKADFTVLCDKSAGVGMFTFATETPDGSAGRGWGFAVRMTDEEYARYCDGDNEH